VTAVLEKCTLTVGIGWGILHIIVDFRHVRQVRCSHQIRCNSWGHVSISIIPHLILVIFRRSARGAGGGPFSNFW
jgi:hypothetical protein